VLGEWLKTDHSEYCFGKLSVLPWCSPPFVIQNRSLFHRGNNGS
jgi:hypothetical protein